MLLIGSAPENQTPLFFHYGAGYSFSMMLLLYMGLLTLIYSQIRLFKIRARMHREKLLFLTNLEIVTFFLFSYFILGVQSFILTTPFGPTLLAIFSLTLYFGALATYHYLQLRQVWDKHTSLCKAGTIVRFLIPFALPFTFFIALNDILNIVPFGSLNEFLGMDSHSLLKSPLINGLISAATSIAAVLLVMVLSPALIVYIWGCPPLEDATLIPKLEELCKRAHFKHAGFKIWNVMEDNLTAAIIGIVGRFRYIMFTRKLIARLRPEAIEAILAHEIGHSRHKHLLIYPLILSGMLVVGYLSTALFYLMFMEFFFLENAYNAYPLLTTLFPLMTFIVFSLSVALYFRLVFGYFSRIFERQADLHVFEVQIPPKYMIEALNEIAVAAGNIHHVPSWHHYSIQQRIDFISQAIEDPKLLIKHRLKVNISVIIYIIIFLPATALLGMLLA